MHKTPKACDSNWSRETLTRPTNDDFFSTSWLISIPSTPRPPLPPYVFLHTDIYMLCFLFSGLSPKRTLWWTFLQNIEPSVVRRVPRLTPPPLHPSHHTCVEEVPKPIHTLDEPPRTSPFGLIGSSLHHTSFFPDWIPTLEFMKKITWIPTGTLFGGSASPLAPTQDIYICIPECLGCDKTSRRTSLRHPHN